MTTPLVLAQGAVVVPWAEINVEAARSGGPGGQHVNRTETKVTLRFAVGASSMPDWAKARIREKLASRITTDDEILVSSDRTRSKNRNLADARLRLQTLLDSALRRRRVRRATRPTRSSQERRLHAKRSTAEKKAARRPVRDD